MVQGAGDRVTEHVYTVTRVPNKRKPGQTMLTFWLPDAEAEAARQAVTDLDTTISDECRRALRNTVKRAERKRAEQEGQG